MDSRRCDHETLQSDGVVVSLLCRRERISGLYHYGCLAGGPTPTGLGSREAAGAGSAMAGLHLRRGDPEDTPLGNQPGWRSARLDGTAGMDRSCDAVGAAAIADSGGGGAVWCHRKQKDGGGLTADG